MFDNLDQYKQLGIAGSAILPFIAYKIYQMFKEDKKGNTVDARIDAFSTRLQVELDKIGAKYEALSKIKDDLIKQNAEFAAELKFAQSQLLLVQESAMRHIQRIKYLESLLKEKGIEYVA